MACLTLWRMGEPAALGRMDDLSQCLVEWMTCFTLRLVDDLSNFGVVG